MSLHGKIVLITGGSRGIGRATARAFAAEGATVVLAGRDVTALADAVKEIGSGTAAEGTAGGAAGRADHVVADVADPASAARMVETVVARHGGLHVAVNNAGIIGAAGPVTDIDPAAWDEVLAVNLTGVFLSMKHEIAHMRAHGGGTIVNVASNIGAHRRLPGMAAYAASKAAVSVLTRTAALDHIGDGVRINAVSPGASDTPMSLRPGESETERAARMKASVPAGRVAATSEVASTILWLASDASTHVVGHDLVIDGGVTA
ncbi:NAD(P)-dependent dehydrogenase, short-chain alcohol dehydrogenase family [Actinomadura meyerae]|uniref:NAD(P)-dependent dehydrogenase, short-chain alcohol dehydrogenase family n=1 Tax=Actinomadura meyerae TaxID=240840 RepID=A0A239KLG4_9ACTN|nr:glucose 1-dehydrogenase [Actinomadura meyerae]SNT18443.1 NAD(P)-dependent dehydrogenase, short-chain alcohol dehydrogenase family [Actinomadura meyerae]